MTMTYLISSTGLSARIHELPGREPFMLAADLADAYATETRNIVQAAKRNPERFPEDFAFELTERELERLRSQNVISDQTRYLPLAFTHAGALALSGVLKTPTAAEVSVAIHRGFAAMERRALETMRYTMLRLQIEAKARSGLRSKLIDGARAGLTFDAIWRMTSTSQVKLAQIARDCVGLGLIDALPEGTPPAEQDLFASLPGLCSSGTPAAPRPQADATYVQA